MKGRIFTWDYVIFAAKIWTRKLFSVYVPFMTLQSIGFEFFVKIMKGSCVFCCSSCISFNPTSHLNSNDFWKFMLHFNMSCKIIVRKSCKAKRHTKLCYFSIPYRKLALRTFWPNDETREVLWSTRLSDHEAEVIARWLQWSSSNYTRS